MDNENTGLDTWWSASRDEVADQVVQLVRTMVGAENIRRTNNVLYASLYDNRPYSMSSHEMFDAGTMATGFTLDGLEGPMGMTYNVCKSLIDTLVARITKHKPSPRILTTDGEWSQQQRAKRLTRYIEAQFSALDVYKQCRMVFRDACVYGTGLLKVQLENDRIRIDRVLPSSVMVPAAEAWYGQPRQLHHRYFVHQSVLVSLFGKKKREAIELAAGRFIDMAVLPVVGLANGMVEVYESYHLPSGPEAGDGRRTICIQDECLLDEEWSNETFPFAIIHFDNPLQGFWGQGIVEQFKTLQAALNENIGLIKDSIRLTARPITLIKKGADLSQKVLDNRVGACIEVNDMNDFKVVATGAVPEVAIAQRNELFDKMFALAGVSKLASQGTKPPGLDAAVALREFEDIEADRFAVQQQQFEDLLMDLAKQVIRLSKQAAEDGIDIDVKASDVQNGRLERIRWSEVDIDDARTQLEIYSSSHLPRTPAGRLEFIQEMINSGMLDQKQGLRLLGFPDIEQVTSLQNAPLDDIYRCIDDLLDGKPYEAPEPFQDLDTGIKLMQSAYLKHRKLVPDHIAENLRQWIQDAGDLMDQAAAQAQAAQPPPGPGPEPDLGSAAAGPPGQVPAPGVPPQQ